MIYASEFDLVDTHCHINLEEFDSDRGEVLARANKNGIGRILIPGIDLETSKRAITFAGDYEFLYAAVGIHPNYGMSWMESSLDELIQLTGEMKVVAIGEIGLDYYRDYTPKEIQHTIFIQQLDLAAKVGLPVVVHNRDASDDITDMLLDWYAGISARNSNLALRPGVLHSFSGSVEMAELLAEKHFRLGVTGAVTFQNSQAIQAVVAALPLESLVIETDAPYQTPHPFRGTRNEPSNVRIVAEKISLIKGIPVEEVKQATTREAERLFNWKEAH